MLRTFYQAAVRRHLLKAETPTAMLKTDLRSAEMVRRQKVGRALEQVWKASRQPSGEPLGLKEFAARLGRDERQVKRWMTGEERIQLDAIYAVADLWSLFVVQLARLPGSRVEIETTMRLRECAS